MSGVKKVKGKLDFHKNALIHRYHSSRWTFIFATLVFFLNYLFVGGNFYYQFFIRTLPYTYIVFVISIIFFLFFTIQKIYAKKLSPMISYVIFAVIALVFSAGLLPFIIKLG